MNSVRTMPARAPSILPPGWHEACEHKWSYISRTMAMCRHALTASTKRPEILKIAGPGFPDRVKYITTRMKLASIVGVPFSLSALKSTVQKIFSSMRLNDSEGLTLSMLSFVVISADIADSVTTFVNAALETALMQPISAFSAIGLPLGYTITILGTISRVVQIAKTCGLYSSLKHGKGSVQNRIELRSQLASKFELTAEVKRLMLSEEDKQKLLEKKHADLLRAAPPEAVAELKELYLMLRDHSLNSEKVSKKLDHVQALLVKKMGVDAIGIGANLVGFSALCMFSLGAVSATPFILLATSFFIRISGSAVQDLYKP